jgi:F-type H+-transporting ATPase subunit b
VLDVIARRRAGIDKALSDAKAERSEAQKLQNQYEGRLADWEQERRQEREKLAQELEAERTTRMEDLQTELEQEREKSRVAETRRQTEALRTLETTALEQGARFASRVLELAAGPDLQTRLAEMLCTGLNELPPDEIEKLRTRYGKSPDHILVTSAFPLADDQRRQLEQALGKVAGQDIPFRYEQRKDLLAGLRVAIGAWVLGANVLDELKGFADLSPGNLNEDQKPSQ